VPTRGILGDQPLLHLANDAVSGAMSARLHTVPAASNSRRRPKITATLDPDLLASVDAYVAAHPQLDRSAVIDEALRLWRARELELAMEAQFAAPAGVDPIERQAWDQLRRGAVGRQLGAVSDQT
jgi:hypothetical protein